MPLFRRTRPRHAAPPSRRVSVIRIATIVACGAAAFAVAIFAERRIDGGVEPAGADDPLARVVTSAGDPAATASSMTPSSATVTSAPVTSIPTATTLAAAAPTTAPPTEAARPVTLAFGGDVHFEGFLAESLRQDPAGLLSPLAPVLGAADVAVVNLETSVTERGEPEPKTYTFRAPELAYTALAAAGVDIVSVANNHGWDFGQVGLLDTLDAAARNGIEVIGAGRNTDEAYGAHHVEVAGRRIAFIAATQIIDGYALDRWVPGPDSPGLASALEPYLQRLLDEVAAQAAHSDAVVVFLHWGRERETCPIGQQQDLAQRLVDAGADVVVGAHAHRLQGGGFLGGAVVHYGLGNLVFYKLSGPGTDSGVFQVTIEVDGSLHYRWIPAVLQGGVATPLSADLAAQHQAAWDELRACTGLAA
jgi:Bacterial capsule synthesis protein PGA_cap